MRTVGIRKKKLTAAFHFQFASQAGWECGSCRKQGLERKRRCGWLRERGEEAPRPVWIRKRFSLAECPRSFIRPQSLAYLEEFYAWRMAGRRDLLGLAMRKAEAFLILEGLLAEEHNDERRKPR